MTKPLTLDDLARAIHDDLYSNGESDAWMSGKCPLDSVTIDGDVDLVKAARAVLTTIKEAGWTIVPVEANRTMESAVHHANLDIYWTYLDNGRPGEPRDAYAAMIAASPQIEGE